MNYPNPDKPEPKKKEQSRKHERTGTRKKDRLDFVLFKFRVFVMKIFFIKCKDTAIKILNVLLMVRVRVTL